MASCGIEGGKLMPSFDSKVGKANHPKFVGSNPAAGGTR
jgi:hypothetical protein